MSEQYKPFKVRVSEARKKGFTASFNRVAEYIEGNLLKAALSTASMLARANEVDPATVVRMSQRLGYRGYPELRAELAASIVQKTDIITGTELLPLLSHERPAVRLWAAVHLLGIAPEPALKVLEFLDKNGPPRIQVGAYLALERYRRGELPERD